MLCRVWMVYCAAVRAPEELGDSPEGFLHILENVVDMLCPDRETDRIWADTLIGQLLLGALTMRRCGWVDDKRFDIRYVCQQGEQLQIVDKVHSSPCIAFDFKGKNRAAAIWKIFGVERLLGGILGNGRVMNRFYLRMMA